MQKLEIKARDTKESLSNIRKEGLMPAVLYGKVHESTPVSLSQKEFIKTWKDAGESSVIELTLDGTVIEALIHDVDLDPVTDTPRHADFYVFEKGHAIEVDVPIEFVGIAPGVKDFGGILVKVRHDLAIEAMPKDLPHELTVDISGLTEVGSQITAADITLPTGVTLKTDPEEIVVSVSGPKAEEPEEPAAPLDMSQIEVEKKGKEKEEAEEEGSSE